MQFLAATSFNNMAADWYSDEISLSQIVRVLWARKVLIGALALSGAVVALVMTFFEGRIYRAETMVSVVTQPNGQRGGLSSQLAEFAPLVGIDLGGSSDGVRQEQLAYLRSRSLVREFIQRRQLMPILFAWRWDEDRKYWKYPRFLDEPTIEDGVDYFIRRIRAVSEDRKTGLISVTVDWRDSTIVAEWANGLIAMANENARATAISDASRSIDYLNNELTKAGVIEIRQAIYRLLESQLNRVMVATVRPQYAFKVIESALPVDRHRFIQPNVALQVSAGFLIGGILASLVVLVRHGPRLSP
jgi:LPS O-antigen subunit length determinant protein (WzzB/FepE family)